MTIKHKTIEYKNKGEQYPDTYDVYLTETSGNRYTVEAYQNTIEWGVDNWLDTESIDLAEARFDDLVWSILEMLDHDPSIIITNKGE